MVLYVFYNIYKFKLHSVYKLYTLWNIFLIYTWVYLCLYHLYTEWPKLGGPPFFKEFARIFRFGKKFFPELFQRTVCIHKIMHYSCMNNTYSHLLLSIWDTYYNIYEVYITNLFGLYKTNIWMVNLQCVLSTYITIYIRHT